MRSAIFLLSAAVLSISSNTLSARNTSHLFFDDGNIQDVYLTVDPADWAALRQNYLDNTYYKANFTWNGTSLDIGIRSRGHGTRSPEKPNLDLNIDKYKKKQTFLGIAFLVLKGSNSDASMMRERLALRVIERMGLTAPREAYARLFINGEFFGLYVASEHEDEDFLERNFGESGGFLYEFKANKPFFFNYLGEDPTLYSPVLFDPKTHEDDPDPQPIIDMVRTVNEASDSDFVSAISKYLNPKMFLTEIATEIALSDYDDIVGVSGMNNFYLYRFQDGVFSQFTAWDMDSAFSEPREPVDWGISLNVLARRAMAVPELRETYSAALLKAAGLIESSWLESELNRLYALIRDDAIRDRHKQCSLDGVLFSCGAAEFEADVVHLHQFVAERPAFLRSEAEANGLIPPAKTPQIYDNGVVNVASSSVSTLAPGGLASIYGSNLLSGSGSIPVPASPREMNSITVMVQGARAPILYASNSQINFQVPWETAPGANAVTVSAQGTFSNTIISQVDEVAPGVLLAIHPDGTAVDAAHPIHGGEKLALYAVGLGPVDQPVGTGEVAQEDAPAATVYPITVSIRDQKASVDFAGLVPGVLGLYRIDLTLPGNTAAGSASVSVSVQDHMAPAFTLPVI
jgi:uncharacterized protein (TIGR03437 family)